MARKIASGFEGFPKITTATLLDDAEPTTNDETPFFRTAGHSHHDGRFFRR